MGRVMLRAVALHATNACLSGRNCMLKADRAKELLLLLAGGAQGAWRHCFAGY
jgi:hypothetical protein